MGNNLLALLVSTAGESDHTLVPNGADMRVEDLAWGL